MEFDLIRVIGIVHCLSIIMSLRMFIFRLLADACLRIRCLDYAIRECLGADDFLVDKAKG